MGLGMLDQNDLELFFLEWIKPQQFFMGPTPAERWRLLRKALAVLDHSETLKDDAKWKLHREFLAWKDDILELDPKLAESDPTLAPQDAYPDLVLPWEGRRLFLTKNHPSI